MFGKNKDVAKKGFRTVDKVVTGLILGGVVASIYGVKKYEERKHQTQAQSEPKKPGLISRIIFAILWRK